MLRSPTNAREGLSGSRPGRAFVLPLSVILVSLLLPACVAPGRPAPSTPSPSRIPLDRATAPAMTLAILLDLPPPSTSPQPTPMPNVGPRPLCLPPGAASTTVGGTLPSYASYHHYVVHALAGRSMELTVVAPDPIVLDLSGENGTVVAIGERERTTWKGRLPSRQDYVLKLRSPGDPLTYELTVTATDAADLVAADVTYRNPELRFWMDYPASFGIGTCPAGGALIDDPAVLFRLLDDWYYVGTNLLDAYVGISVDPGKTTASTCLEPRDSEEPEERQVYLGHRQLNDARFSVVRRAGARSRHTHEVTSYRT